MEAEKVYFCSGDVVTLKQDIANKPNMIVKNKKMVTFRVDNKILQGITCRWFNTNMELQEAVFSTKDLIKVK